MVVHAYRVKITESLPYAGLCCIAGRTIFTLLLLRWHRPLKRDGVKLLARLLLGKESVICWDGVAFAEKSIRQTEKLSTSQPTTTLLSYKPFSLVHRSGRSILVIFT